MRCRGSVVVIASFLASSLMLAPAQLADALADAPNCLEFISRTATLLPPDGASYGGPISGDGRSVLFASEATNLGPTDTNAAVRDVFVRDTDTGALELVTSRCRGVGRVSHRKWTTWPVEVPTPPRASRPVYFPATAGDVETTIYDRDSLAVDQLVTGPSIIEEWTTTILVPPDWKAATDRLGNLILSKHRSRE